MKNEILTVLQMGGYAFYVWSAYLSATCILSGLICQTWRRERQLRQRMSTAGQS